MFARRRSSANGGRSLSTVALAAVATAWAGPAWAGAWVLPHGELWLKTSASYWQTDRRFASQDDRQLNFGDRGPVEAGDRIPFDPTTGGEFRALSLFADAQLGLFDALQVGARLPILWADFNETRSADTIEASFGVGDLWLSLQGAPTHPVFERVHLAARVDLKLPVGDFDPSVFSAPLTEGQVDVNVAALVGVSLHPFGYANIEAGWRFRLENGENQQTPGDELRFSLEVGANLPADLMVKAVFDGVVGFRRPRPIRHARRRAAEATAFQHMARGTLVPHPAAYARSERSRAHRGRRLPDRRSTVAGRIIPIRSLGAPLIAEMQFLLRSLPPAPDIGCFCPPCSSAQHGAPSTPVDRST